MGTFEAYRTADRLRRSRQQPMLLFGCQELRAMAKQICQAHLPEVTEIPQIHFVQRGTLACLVQTPDKPPHIFIHAVLNDHDVPDFIYRCILKHELLHLVVPSREIKGKLTYHPPEFIERERQIAPEKNEAWRWLYLTFGNRLKRRPRKECMEVLPPRRRHRCECY